MPHLPEILRAFSRLLSYPDERMLESAEFLYVALQPEQPEAAHHLSEFGRFVEQIELHELEETYTSTFEINPPCALDIGWHLFGEEYERGQFLVRMREELRKHGIAELPGELPDHVTHVLSVIAAMSDDEARRFTQACVLPALAKMRDALEVADSPWAGVVRSLLQVLRHHWPHDGEPAEERYEQVRASRTTANGVDLLHAFPVADAPFFDPIAETGCQGGVELVPLQVNFHSQVNGSALHHHQPHKHA